MTDIEQSTNSDLATKLAQFDEFFSIAHDFSVNFTRLDKAKLPSFEQFVGNIPLPFKIASDMVAIDQAALRPIQGLSGNAGQLVDYLNLQSQKIDLLIGYILSQQDDENTRYQGIKVGGGGLIFKHSDKFAVGDMLEMKVFLLAENCAVYCIGEVVEVVDAGENSEQASEFHHKVIFSYLREEDREMLVRTSLHLQSKQLQALAKERNKDNYS